MVVWFLEAVGTFISFVQVNCPHFGFESDSFSVIKRLTVEE
jgi:hypothetical protein